MKKHRKFIAIGTVVVVIAAVAAFIWSSKNTLTSAAPDFSALTPAGKTPAWKQSKPQGGKDNSAVYIYSDKINDVSIKVSEQPLPPSFRDDPAGKVAEIAQGFNATDSMQIDGMPVYIGTSAKGPQSVIFSNGTLLILIKSDSVIESGDWADYINALEST
jgi:hypothetical protein